MTTKGELLKAIRLKCLDCCCESAHEVSLCSVREKCTLYPFRIGNDPTPSKARQKIGSQAMKKLKSKKSEIVIL